MIISTALTAPRLPVTINASRGEPLIVFSIAGGEEHRVQRHGEAGVNTALVDRLIELVDADAEQPESAVYLRQVGVGPTQTSIIVVAEFVDHPELQSLALWVFVELVLGKVVAHDARYNSQLLSTLSASLDCHGLLGPYGRADPPAPQHRPLPDRPHRGAHRPRPQPHRRPLPRPQAPLRPLRQDQGT